MVYVALGPFGLGLCSRTSPFSVFIGEPTSGLHERSRNSRRM